SGANLMLRSHGRESQHSAMISGITDINWPPPPPDNINERAQREWRDATSNLSSDAMPRESLPLLAVWCCLKIELDDVMLDLAKFQCVPTRTEENDVQNIALVDELIGRNPQFFDLTGYLRRHACHLDTHTSISGARRRQIIVPATSAMSPATIATANVANPR